MKRIAWRLYVETIERVEVEFEHGGIVRRIQHAREQAVVWRHEIVVIVLDEQNVAFSAYAGVDYRQMHASLWKILITSTNPEARLGWPLRGYVVRKVDDFGVMKAADDHAFHHSRKRTFVAKVRGNRYDT
jgi:hypothetical protein